LERELRGPAPFDYDRRAAIARESSELLHGVYRHLQRPGKSEGFDDVRERSVGLAYEAIGKAYPPGF
jgi:hypothetical protein